MTFPISNATFLDSTLLSSILVKLFVIVDVCVNRAITQFSRKPT